MSKVSVYVCHLRFSIGLYNICNIYAHSAQTNGTRAHALIAVKA